MTAMLGLVFGTTLAVSIIFIWYIRSTTLNTLSEAIEPLSQQTALNFDYSVSEYIRDFKELVESSSYATLLTEEEKIAASSDKFSDNDMISDFGIYSSDGELLKSSGSGCADVIEESDVVSAVERGEVTVTDIKNINNQNYFGILAPTTYNGSTEVSAAIVDCTLINEEISNSVSGSDNSVFVISDDGVIIFSSDTQSVKTNQSPIELANTDDSYAEFSDALKTALNGKSGTYTYDYNDTEYTMGYSEASYFDAIVIVAAPTSSYLSLNYTTLRIIILMITAVVVVTLLVSIIFARKISTPIVSTTKRLRALSNGDISTRVDVWYSKDELGILSNSLEETIVSLRQYINLI